MVIFLTCSRYKQKTISNKLFTFAQCAGSRARGAVAGLDEASAMGLTSVIGVGRGVAVGVAVAVGVGVGVGVPPPAGAWIATIIGDPVLKNPTVALVLRRRLIGVKPEVIQCAPADRVRVLILRKRFAVPSYGITRLSDSPGHAAVTLVVKRAVVCPARFLGRRVKSDVTDIGSSTQRHAKGLNAAIEILVVQGVLIVIDSRRGIGHFVAHKPDTIVSRIRLLLIYRRPCPSHDGRVHSHGRTNGENVKFVVPLTRNYGRKRCYTCCIPRDATDTTGIQAASDIALQRNRMHLD